MEKAFSSDRAALTQNLALEDVRISTPTGEIRLDRYTDFFITRYQPGCMSIMDCTLSRSLGHGAERIGISTVEICPRNSRIEFDFIPHVSLPDRCEALYRRNAVRTFAPGSVTLPNGVTVGVQVDKEHVVVTSTAPIQDESEKAFRLAWSILQGRALETRAVYGGGKIVLNLSSPDDRTSPGPLFTTHDAFVRALNSAVRFWHQLSVDDGRRWESAAHFYLEGISSRALLEFRTINLFVFLEIVDQADTLSKNALATLLQIEQGDADLICRVRNWLIHHGKPLQEALRLATSEARQYGQAPSMLVQEGDEVDMPVRFYFRLAYLVIKIWLAEFGLAEPEFRYDSLLVE